MNQTKKFIWGAVMLLILLLTACGTTASANLSEQTEWVVNTNDPVLTADTTTMETTETTAVFNPTTTATTPESVAEDYVVDTAAITRITLANDAITVEGDGVSINGRIATITTAGTYNLNGTLSEGQIIVDTEDEETVQLILDGVDISNTTTAPIYVANAQETVIILADNSTNVVTDGTNYIFPDAETDEPNAAVFSHDDLTIYGSGSLTVNGNYNDGIVSKDGLIIASGNITVNAADDGIRGKDYLIVKDGNLTVNTQGDGLKSDEDEDTTKGYISVENGNITITSGGDAITAQTDVLISGGTFNLTTSGGSSGVVAAETSAKGIKGGVNVAIDGGTFTINAADDAVHSNGTMIINGGNFTIASGDDGMHADASLEINDGTIDIQKSYEGLEATDVIINGGTIDIIASDDGINGAGGNDNSSTDATNGGQPDRFAGSQGTITINGGTITIAAAGSGNGDGLDANGTMTISGGDTVIKVPSSYRDYSNIDFDTTISFTGGRVRTLDANGTYTEVTSDTVGMMGGFGGPGGGRPGGGGRP